MGFKSNYQGGASIESPEALLLDLRNRKIEGLLSHQADVLRVYQGKMNFPDVAMELPTGSGKTLIGILIGEYRRRMQHERVVYLCPTKQLVHQVVEEAKNKYDIHPIAFTGSNRKYNPLDKAAYRDGEAIAVTTYSSLFNSGPFFDNPNFIILDDAHAAENYLVKFWSMQVNRFEHGNLYRQLLETFKHSMPLEQYQRMKSDSATPDDKGWVEKLPTPKFAQLIPQVIPLLDEATPGIDGLKYDWRVLRNHLRACHVYVSWNEILIRPIIPPSTTFTPFSSAKQRLYLSATLGSGGELERITGRRNIERIKAPEGWDKHGIGRRLFFFPETSGIKEESGQVMVNLVKESPRALLLVKDDSSEKYLMEWFNTNTDRTVFLAEDIERTKHTFTSHTNAVAILANRYDGINLAGDECRLEVMWGLPSASNLQERFLESRMSAQLLLRERIRTRLVQAIGRCTRSATDYSVVCIYGEDLSNRLLQHENLKLYHPELQAELSFGREESKQANSVEDFLDMYRIFLKQNSPEWRAADQQIIVRRQGAKQAPDPNIDVLEKAVSFELSYQEAMWSGDYERALENANRVTSLLSGDALKGYRGFWYYLAGCAAWYASQSNENFKAIAQQRFNQAANCTSSVPWLRKLVEFDSLGHVEDQDPYTPVLIERLEFELNKMGTTNDRKFENRVNEILSGLADQTDSKRFERAHVDLGRLLGYNADNTDEDGGPDPWWIVGDFCLTAEDYTETDGKKPISLYKVRQANDHPTWISKKVPGISENTEFVRVIISPSNSVESAAVTIARDVAYWNQESFVKWAHESIAVIRRLRLDFPGEGDEMWREKAIIAYRENGMDPLSIKERLKMSPISSLTILG